MQHDHVLKKLNLDPITRVRWVGDLRAKYLLPCCYISWFHLIWYDFDLLTSCLEWKWYGNLLGHISAFMIPFSLICIMTIFWKRWILIYRRHLRGQGVGVCRRNICYLIALIMIFLNLICNMTMFWKSRILTYLPHSQGQMGYGVCVQKSCYHFSVFSDST